MPKAALEQSADWAAREVYWATIAYARWWLAVDGPFLGAIEADRGFTVPVLRAVARRYNVNRGLLRSGDQPKNQDGSAAGMIKLLRGAQETWPSDLAGRAKRCASIAATASANNWTNGLQVSAVSKFMWFLEPAGWTMFDRFAATGMGVAHATRDRFARFYLALKDREFDRIIRQMQPIIDDSCLPGLPAERIIDSLLMARGGRGCEQHDVDESRTFLALLPQAFRNSLDALATKLDGKLTNDVLRPAV